MCKSMQRIVLCSVAILTLALGLAGCTGSEEAAFVDNGSSLPPSSSQPQTGTDTPAAPPADSGDGTDGGAGAAPAATYEVAFSVSSYTVEQSAGVVVLKVNRNGALGGAITVDYRTSDGSATAGVDYTAAQGQLSWTESDSTPKDITIALGSEAFTGERTFQVALLNPGDAATIGNPGTVSVDIHGSMPAAAGTLQFASPAYSVSQSAQSVVVSVSRIGGSSGASSVTYSTADASAANGADYSAVSGTLSWSDGDASVKSFDVPLKSIAAYYGSKAFAVSLQGATGSAQLGDPATAQVTIFGVAQPQVGSLRLAAASYTVDQSSGGVTIQVQRVGGTDGTVSVSYSTSGQSAISGTDFTATSGTLSWAAGDSASKSFRIPLSTATLFSGSKTFKVALSGPSAGGTVGSPGSATVTISGSAEPPPGSVQLSASSYSVNQSAGTVTLNVNRTGGSAGAGSVVYSMTGGSAVAGTDFTSSSGTLSWASGDAAAKAIVIPISAVALFSGTKSFTVTLADAVTVGLGSPSQAIVRINGSAVAVSGSLQFSAAGYTVGQAAGSVTIAVNRTGGSSGAISVSYATSDGTATSGTDYTATSGTLQWGDGDTATKSFVIPVSNASPFTGTRTLTVRISNPTSGVTLGAPTSATVSISGSAVPTGDSKDPFWVYRDGTFSWGGDYSYSATINYKDTAGKPATGTYDLSVKITGAWGAYQPYAGGTVPLWNFDSTGYKYLVFDLEPTAGNQKVQVYFMKVGDVPINMNVNPFSGSYGPKPQSGVWATYKIPLSELGVENLGIYKFAIQDMTGTSGQTFYLNNVGFE